MTYGLNRRSQQIVDDLLPRVEDLRAAVQILPSGATVVDCGVKSEGSLAAGLALSKVCTAGLAEISLVPGELGGLGWPHVQVVSDHPLAASLLSQYAGWQISVEKFFAMGSGPIRAAAAREELFEKLGYREQADRVVGVLEGRKLPGDAVFAILSEKTGVPVDKITLLIAPTASVAGNFQVVARVVETALHKLYEVGFDMSRIRSAFGTAPLSPVAKDDLTGIGRTNDAILYGGRVTLWVRGDDDSLEKIGPRVPADASSAYGKPFLEIFEEAGRDFYKIDPHLFSPAEITFHNLDTGRVHRFGKWDHAVLRRSFGI